MIKKDEKNIIIDQVDLFLRLVCSGSSDVCISLVSNEHGCRLYYQKNIFLSPSLEKCLD